MVFVDLKAKVVFRLPTGNQSLLLLHLLLLLLKHESKVVMSFHQLVFQDHQIILMINIKIVWYVRRTYCKR